MSMKSSASGPSSSQMSKRGAPAATSLGHSSQHTSSSNKSQKAPKREQGSDIEEGEIASDDEAASDEAPAASGGGHRQTLAPTVQKPLGASPAASRGGHPASDAHPHLAPHSGHRSRTSSRSFNSSSENGAGGSFAPSAGSSAANNSGGDIVHRAAAALRAYEESEEGELASDEEEAGGAKPSGPTSVKSVISPRKPPPSGPDMSAVPSARPVVGREWEAPSTTRLADVRSSQPQQSRYASLIPPPHTP